MLSSTSPHWVVHREDVSSHLRHYKLGSPFPQVDDKEAINNVDTSSSDFTILQVNCHTSQLYSQNSPFLEATSDMPHRLAATPARVTFPDSECWNPWKTCLQPQQSWKHATLWLQVERALPESLPGRGLRPVLLCSCRVKVKPLAHPSVAG